MASFLQKALQRYQLDPLPVYAIPIDDFRELDIQSWKYNRPADMERVAEIHSWMAKSGRMDGVLNLAYIQHEGLVCFEGNHRRLALNGITIPVVLVEILWDATHEIVKAEFQRLNKSISVPDLYVEETATQIKVEIQEAVDWFRNTYPTHVSTSGRPQRPNFNRDMLANELHRVQKELQVPVHILLEHLEILNLEYSRKSRDKLSINTQVKCQLSGLWLFAWSPSISVDELESGSSLQ